MFEILVSAEAFSIATNSITTGERKYVFKFKCVGLSMELKI